MIQDYANPASFGHVIAESYQKCLLTRTSPENIRGINLAEEHFDPLLRYGY